MPVLPNQPPIALFAGKGDLPRTLIHIFQKQERSFVVLAFNGQTDKNMVEDLPHIWIHYGEVGKTLAYIKENHIKEIVMAGGLSRPTLN